MRLAVLASLTLALASCGRTPFPDFLDVDDLAARDPLANGCTEVDYLFVVDNSSSMADNQFKLSRSVVDFVEGVDAVLQTVESVHVGVVTTDTYDYAAQGCGGIGGLVTRTGGHNSSDAECGPYARGDNYMTDADDLRTSMECATLVGTVGSTSEAPLAAAREAVAPSLPETRACNEGFIRPGALLVVVFVTDEDANQGTGTYDTLVDAKGGHDDAIVVVTLAHTDFDTCRRTGHARVASNLIGFTESFEHGLVSSICARDFREPFAEATAVVQRACG